jgi:predicted phage-related endonuclease
VASRTAAARLSTRRSFVGGSDARVIMGQDQKALIRLWQEKRGEVGLEDLSGELIVRLDLVTNFSKEFATERATSRASSGLDRGA